MYNISPKDQCVYFHEHKVHNADPDSFRILGKGWAADKKTGFYGVHMLYNCDPESLFRDAQHILFGANIIEADTASYTDLGYGYGKDKKIVFFRGTPLTEADAPTFFLVNGYGVDRLNVYSEGQVHAFLKENADFVANIKKINPDFKFD